MRYRWLRFVAVISALALFAAACGDDTSDDGDGDDTQDTGDTGDTDDDTDDGDGDDTGDTDDGDASAAGEGCTEDRMGGSMTVGTYAPPGGLAPWIMAGSNLAGGIEGAAIFDRLLRYNPETREYEPWVAESLEPNDDYTEWTLTLPDDVNFGNGDPLTTEAVQFTIERLQSDETTVQVRNVVLKIQDMEIIDDQQMVFTLENPWVNFPSVLSDEAGMVVNPAVVEEMGEEDFNLNPVGAGVGPYEPETFAPGEEIVFTAKDDYWGGPVCIEELRFIWIPGAQPTYEAFQQGEVDLFVARDPIVTNTVQEAGHQMFSNMTHSGETLLLNNREEGVDVATSDERLRLAIQHAVDPQQVAERAWEGTGLPSREVIHDESSLSPGVPGPELDPERAAELVEEVKADGWDGTLTFRSDSAREEAAITIEAQLENVGIDVELDTSDGIGDHIARVSTGFDFELAMWGLTFYESSLWYRMEALKSDSGSNRSGYANPDMDAALDEFREAATEDEQRESLGQIQQIWTETAPSVNLASVEEIKVWQDHVEGLTFTSKAVPLFSDAYLTE